MAGAFDHPADRLQDGRGPHRGVVHAFLLSSVADASSTPASRWQTMAPATGAGSQDAGGNIHGPTFRVRARHTLVG